MEQQTEGQTMHTELGIAPASPEPQWGADAPISTVVSKEELTLLLEIADSHSYAEMACDRNITVSGLKSKAFRIREKVRKSRISAALRVAALGPTPVA